MKEVNSNKKIILSLSIVLCIVVICSIIFGIVIYHKAYNKGFDDNQPISDDGSPIVYVTPSGNKYHKKNCSHLNGNEISISLTQANKKGYIACSKCNPTSVSINSEIKSNNTQASAGQIVDSKNNTGLQNNISQDTLNYISNLNKKLKERAEREKEERRQKGKCLKYGCRSTPFDNHDYCTQHRCKLTHCENEKNTYSDYCSHHCCSWSSCTDPITNKDSIYCETHTCHKDGCNIKVSYNSKYCIKHK